MRKIIFIFFLVLVLCIAKSNLYAQNNWNLISSPGQNLVITSDEVSYIFENNETGPHHVECLVKKSHNYCQSYETKFAYYDDTYSPRINEMVFINSDLGFFTWGMEYVGVKKTIDGGNSFELLDFSPTYASKIFSFNGDVLFYTDGWVYDNYKMSYFKRNGNIIYSTSDYIWGTRTINVAEEPIAELEFVNDSLGFITCIDSLNTGYILKTSNQGYTWNEVESISDQIFNDIKFATDSIGVVIGNGGLILRTIDLGETWNEIALGISEDLNSVDFHESGFGVIVGNGGKVLLSSDFGENWEIDDFFNSSKHFGYTKITGANTAYVHTKQGDLYCNHNILNNPEIESSPFEIMPNPAQDFISISFKKDVSFNQINIYNLNGEKVLSSTFSKVDIQDLNSGVYIVQVVSDNNTWLEKVIIL